MLNSSITQSFDVLPKYSFAKKFIIIAQILDFIFVLKGDAKKSSQMFGFLQLRYSSWRKIALQKVRTKCFKD